MQVFRKYFAEKLNDPAFNKAYFDNCAICPTTIRIVNTLSESSFSVEEIAGLCDISPETIRHLETADQCCVTAVKKLCNYFNIPGPKNCLKMGKKP